VAGDNAVKNSNGVKKAILVVSLIGAIFSGAWYFDGRYAKAEEVRQQISEIKMLYLTSERRALRREKFDLESTSQRRPLTALERQRLSQIGEDLKELEWQMGQLPPAKAGGL